jgi:molecular chaperone DnaK (HSP70)
LSYAIDFGTSNTVIARWNPVTNQAEMVTLPSLTTTMTDRVGQTAPLVPSLVYVENAAQAQVMVGQQIRDRGLDLARDPRFFRNFKRGIGASVQGFLPTLDDQAITFEQVGQWYLGQLLRQLQQIDPQVKESLVLTVPVDSFETYRQWLGQSCQDLEIDQIRLIDEPTAAALGYGMADQDTLLVVDFGGGTLDLAVVQLDATGKGTNTKQTQPLGFILKWGEKYFNDSPQSPKTAKVIAKAGQNLGGSDIDHWLVDYFSQTQNLPLSSLTTRLAERLKIQLSSQSQASEVYFDEANFETIDLSLARPQFHEILEQHGFLAKLDASMTQLLQQCRRAGVPPEQIDGVLLVGGTSQLPIVQTWIEQYFPSEKIRSQRPFSAIAEGALQVSQGLDLQDFLYHGYGIRYWDHRQNCHSWHPLIRAGQAYPMPEPVELVLGASVGGQPSVELIIGELGSETGGTEVFFDGDRLITRSLNTQQQQVQPLNDRDGARQIAQLNPPGQPGSDRIKLQFRVDGNCSLRLTVDDLLTDERLLQDQVVAQLS